MRTAVGGLIVGCVLASLLMIFIPFFAAWLACAVLGIVVQVKEIHKFVETKTSIGFWIIIGAVIPIYHWVLKGFSGVI